MVLLTLTPAAGCLDLFGRGFADYDVARTVIDETGWNTDGSFTVHVREPEPHVVRIEAVSGSQLLTASGTSNATSLPVVLEIPDGTWQVRYFIDGKKWESFKAARFDSTPPDLAGLELVGEAVDGRYTIQGAALPFGTQVRVIAQSTGAVVATQLPATIASLGDGLHTFDVIAIDEAGNQAVEQIQVRAGSAIFLPGGQYTFGLVARYTVDVQLWDITELETWTSRSAARAAANQQWLGDGRGITPNDADVKAVVGAVVTPEMTTGEAALALFRWMADNLEYDETRLESNTLLTPRQTLLDGEDPDDAAGSATTGLAADGAGNGVRGGVCRDLAGLYVSLLRAAGVPARLVTGYLGGTVNGFHAWVEFYGGSGHGASPWVPVDVSPIDGPYDANVALQAFGIRHTDMLPLRVVTEAQEQGRWSTAVALATQFPAGSPPDVTAAKDLDLEFPPFRGSLCVRPDDLWRATSTSRNGDQCPAGALYLPDFILRATQVLDYGANIQRASKDTTVTLTLSYPDDAAVAPGTVEHATYHASFKRDEAAGTLTGSWNS